MRIRTVCYLALTFRNQIKSNQIKSNQIKSNQIKSNQIKSILSRFPLLSPKWLFSLRSAKTLTLTQKIYIKTYVKVLLSIRLVFVPGYDAVVRALHYRLCCLVGPLGAEHKDLRGLLQILLVHIILLLTEHITREGLRAGGRDQHSGTRTPRTTQIRTA